MGTKVLLGGSTFAFNSATWRLSSSSSSSFLVIGQSPQQASFERSLLRTSLACASCTDFSLISLSSRSHSADFSRASAPTAAQQMTMVGIGALLCVVCFLIERRGGERDLASCQRRPLVRLGEVENRPRRNQFVPDPPSCSCDLKTHQRPRSLRKLSRTSCRFAADALRALFHLRPRLRFRCLAFGTPATSSLRQYAAIFSPLLRRSEGQVRSTAADQSSDRIHRVRAGAAIAVIGNL